MRFILISPFQPDQMKAQKESQEQRAQAINSMLSQLLDQQARARLNTLKISKPEKAEMVSVQSMIHPTS
jgi:programmed cell death protein 5